MTTADVFPELRLETPRLLLRRYRAEDAPDVARACRDELTQRWLPLPNPYTDADAAAWCTDLAHRFRTSGVGVEAAAIRREDGRLIGSFGLKRTDWRARSSEIGYWVAPWARGQGVAVEATLAIARWLLLEQGFERLALRAAIGNLASQRVAEKAGFTREGVARNAGINNSGRVDLVIFSLTPADLVESASDDASADASADDVDTTRALQPAMRTIVIGVAQDGDRIFVVDGYDKYKSEVFYRPPGGGIEFGETSEIALRREFREELGADLARSAYLGTLENIFTYEGQPGHEVVMVYRVYFADMARFSGEAAAGSESDGNAFTARWLSLEAVRRGQARLYPDGLLVLLDR